MNTKLLPFIGLLLSGIASAQDKPIASFVDLPWRYVIGGYAEGKWMKSDATGKQLSAEKMEYRVFTLTGEAAKVSAGKAAPDAEICPDVWLQKITPEPDETLHAIAVNATWEPMPRKARATDTTQVVYVNAVRDLLLAKGISKPEVKISQIFRVDLEGDGVDEVILSATHFANSVELISPKAGDYSFVAMRRVGGEKLETQILEGNFYPKSDDLAAPNTFEVAGLLDLDGDGKLEVITRSAYYEGGGTQVWQLQGNKLVQVLAIECGV